ncbi:hypothetical protein [Mesorhizobium sp. Mes31]|uniref:hypothetical protein n=1 Tax=Mesorhizobium sp. Mes31 TaxID=2926017 RepID=UPI0021198727|nr:hypothetical protein [Mesorhizobium sp. Mes31]
MSDHAAPSPSQTAEQLEAILQKEGIPEELAKRFAEIADRHYRDAQKPDELLVRREVEKFVSKMMTAQPLNENQRNTLRDHLVNFLISFSASGAFALVSYYVIILKQFFMSVETEAIRKDKETAAKMYEMYFADLSPAERRFIGRNMNNLEKVRIAFRRGLTEAISHSGTVENAGLAAVYFNMSIEENLIVEPLRQKLCSPAG